MAVFPFDLTAISEAVIAPFGESIVYRPRGGGAETYRTITANVERNDGSLMSGTDRAISTSFIITVRNHATLGILSTEIDTGGDAIAVAPRVGQTAVVKKITNVIDDDNGWVTFEVQ